MANRRTTLINLEKVINAILSVSKSEWEGIKRNIDRPLNKKLMEERERVAEIRLLVDKEAVRREMSIVRTSKGDSHSFTIGGVRGANRILLPPIEDEIPKILLLNVNIKFSSDSLAEYRLGVELIPSTQEGGIGKSIEYRFEAPHDSPRRSHNYWHAQISGAGNNKWIDRTTPCLPMPVQDPISLLFCLIISFYGEKRCNEIHTASGLSGNYLMFMKPKKET